MLELGIGADLLRGVGWLFRIVFFAALAWAIWSGQGWKGKGIRSLLVLAVFFGPMLPTVYRNWQHQKRYYAAKAVFDERCKTAGEKIYKTVDNVEGVLLLNVRPEIDLSELYDQNWSGAGLPDEKGGDWYIRYFLYWERQDDPKRRGQINQRPKNDHGYIKIRGYSFVDIRQPNGKIYRSRFIDENYFDLSHETSPANPARYAVMYQPIIDPADRAQWVAGVTVTITDTQTNEIMAKKTWYSFEPGLGNRNQRTPWGFAITCPRKVGSDAAQIRFFVDQVLKPKQGE
ncbi:hypothetical protein [Ottowia sp.]|uniref:hypothetical protein n=1 Tax=Ottowia sp. TaxID=1898956 RepID=UPI003A83884A